MYLEHHHVIPQDWQDEVKPANFIRTQKAPLWAPATVAVCRTGHGNIHYWLVEFMHRFESLYLEETEQRMIIDAAVSASLQPGRQYHRNEVRLAKLGMQRVADAGLKLITLCENRSYGSIYG